MDHLKEARDALEIAAKFMDEGDVCESDWRLRAAIAHALIAIAERMPLVREWRCCNCGYDWQEAATARPVCPLCGEYRTIPTVVRGECARCDSIHCPGKV